MKVFVRAVVTGKPYKELVFTEIFEKNKWNDDESRSGTGSNLAQTAFLRDALATLLEQRAVGSLLDIPCGDFRWMKEVRLPPGLTYVGADIVEAVVIQNQGRYGNSATSFRKLDLLADQLPTSDLVLCRDCLVHLSSSDIFRAIRNVKMSGSALLLTTHFTGGRKNEDIMTGEWRPINLTRPPFSFPPPVLVMNEQCTEGRGQYADKSLALWNVHDLPD